MLRALGRSPAGDPWPSFQAQSLELSESDRGGEFVLHVRRHHSDYRPFDQSIPLKPSEAERQHSLRHAVDGALEFGKALGTAGQPHDDQHAPLFPNAGKDLADLLAVHAPDARAWVSHIHDTGFPICAVLQHTEVMVTVISRVTILYQGKSVMNVLQVDSSILDA